MLLLKILENPGTATPSTTVVAVSPLDESQPMHSSYSSLYNHSSFYVGILRTMDSPDDMDEDPNSMQSDNPKELSTEEYI